MKSATASSPRSGGHTGNDARDMSVFDFDEKDPRPFRDKQSSKAMFSKAFGWKGNHTVTCASISVEHGKCTRGAKATKSRKQGRKFTKKLSCQPVAIDGETVSQEFLSCSDKIETDNSDSVSEEEVSRLPTMKKGGVVESLKSSRPDKIAIKEKVAEVIISGEAIFLSDGACKCFPCFTFSVDAITLKISICHSDCVFIKWPLKEIRSFGSYACQQSGLVLLVLGLTNAGADMFMKKLNGSIPVGKEGHVLVALISDSDWVERERQITSLSDVFKLLWRPLKVEGDAISASVCGEKFLRSLTAESLDEDYPERHTARLNGMFDTAYQRGNHDADKHEALLRGWFDIVYPKGDHDAVTVTKNDFLLLSPNEFLSDTIIDFYIKYLQSTLSENDKNRFYFFNSFFFRKLTEGEKSVIYEHEKQKYAFKRVKRWTAKVNIFEKDYLFIPIMRSAHWSLIVICHPGCVSREVDEASTCQPPVILHLDSLEGCHIGLEEPIQNYLMEAWIQKYGYAGDWSNLCCKRLSEVKFVSAKVPQQTNYSDCGLFLLHYVELFIQRAHNESPTEFVKEGWFYPAEASVKRAEIQNLIIRLHAMELADRYSSLGLPDKFALPDNLALAVKNKNVSTDDALASEEMFASRVRDSLHSSKAPEAVHNGTVGSIGKTIYSDTLHGENQRCMGIFHPYDHHDCQCSEGEDNHNSHPDLLMPLPASEFRGSLCSRQPQDSISPCKEGFFLCPSHALEAAKDFLGSSRKEDGSILSEQASVNPACVEIKSNSGNFSLDLSSKCLHVHHLCNSCDDHFQKTVEAADTSHVVLRFQERELHDYSKDISAVGIQTGCTVGDETDESPVDSKQPDLEMEYEMEDIKLWKFTRKKGFGDSGSISDTDKEETHLFTIEESMVEEGRCTVSTSASTEQNMVICPSRDKQSKDRSHGNRNTQEDVSLQKQDRICKEIDSERNISIHSNLCPLQEKDLLYENQYRTHEVSLPCIQDASCAYGTQYISSDEEPTTPQYQVGLDKDVEEFFEAVNSRKRCRRKEIEGSKAIHFQGRRPVTRSTTKRRGLKLERGTLLQQGRKHESPIEVK